MNRETVDDQIREIARSVTADREARLRILAKLCDPRLDLTEHALRLQESGHRFPEPRRQRLTAALAHTLFNAMFGEQSWHRHRTRRIEPVDLLLFTSTSATRWADELLSRELRRIIHREATRLATAST